MNKYFLVLIALLLLLYFIARLFISSFGGGAYSLYVAEAVALILMMRNGTFTRSRYYKAFWIVVALIVIGGLMKILHLIGADQVLLVSLMAVPIVYFLHFLSKDKKGLLDFLKLTTVVTLLTYIAFSLLHIISIQDVNQYGYLPHYLFWLTFICFVIAGLRNKTLLVSLNEN